MPRVSVNVASVSVSMSCAGFVHHRTTHWCSSALCTVSGYAWGGGADTSSVSSYVLLTWGRSGDGGGVDMPL